MKKQLNKEKAFKKLGYSHLEVADIVLGLRQLMASLHVHGQKLQHFSWVLKGPHYFPLVRLFTNMSQTTRVHVDSMAKRIQVLGKVPVGTLSEMLRLSKIEESANEKGDVEIVNELLDDLQILLNQALESHERASSNGDIATANVIEGLVLDIEEHHHDLLVWNQLSGAKFNQSA